MNRNALLHSLSCLPALPVSWASRGPHRRPEGLPWSHLPVVAGVTLGCRYPLAMQLASGGAGESPTISACLAAGDARGIETAKFAAIMSARVLDPKAASFVGSG